MSNFRKVTIGGNEYSALKFGRDGYEMPLSVMQNTRQDGLRIKDDTTESFPWYGVTKDEDGQYLLLPPSDYEDIRTLSTVHRHDALRLVRLIARGLKEADKAFPDLLTGIFPLYRIYIENGTSIVLLPPDASSVLTLSRTEEETRRDVRALIAPDREKGFTLAHEMAQLLYFALSGRFPYEREDVRGSGFHPYPLTLYGFDDGTSAFIMNTLSLKEKQMRKICLNYGPQYALGWFLEETEGLEWNASDRSEADLIYERTASEEKEEFTSKKSHKEGSLKRRKAIREKGTVALICTIIAAAVIYFIGNYLYQELKAPETKGLDPAGIIEYTIEQQNNLNAEGVNEGFKGNAPQYMEVTSLFISSRMTYAYGQKDMIVKLSSWLESGKGPIDKDCTVYGVIIDSIEDRGDNQYTARLTYYTPSGMADGDEENNEIRENTARVFVYSVTEEFKFEWNKRGWWLCTSADFSSASLTNVLYIPYKTAGEITSY